MLLICNSILLQKHLWNTRISPFIKKIISASHAVNVLFLSFTCENIGVAIVTKMITIVMITVLTYVAEWSKRFRSLVRYRVEHSKIKLISTRGHEISSVSTVREQYYLAEFIYFYVHNCKERLSILQKSRYTNVSSSSSSSSSLSLLLLEHWLSVLKKCEDHLLFQSLILPNRTYSFPGSEIFLTNSFCYNWNVKTITYYTH